MAPEVRLIDFREDYARLEAGETAAHLEVQSMPAALRNWLAALLAATVASGAIWACIPTAPPAMSIVIPVAATVYAALGATLVGWHAARMNAATKLADSLTSLRHQLESFPVLEATISAIYAHPQEAHYRMWDIRVVNIGPRGTGLESTPTLIAPNVVGEIFLGARRTAQETPSQAFVRSKAGAVAERQTWPIQPGESVIVGCFARFDAEPPPGPVEMRIRATSGYGSKILLISSP